MLMIKVDGLKAYTEVDGMGKDIMHEMAMGSLSVCEQLGRNPDGDMQGTVEYLIRLLRAGLAQWGDITKNRVTHHEQSNPDRQPDARS